MDSNVFLEEFMTELSKEMNGVNVSVSFSNEVVVLAAYILMSIGLFTLARNRGIKHAWLAWIPVVNVWVLGSLSDQYQYLVKGKETNRRKRMLVLNIVGTASAVLEILLSIGWLVGLIVILATNPEADPVVWLLAGVALILLIAVALIVLEIWMLVETYCAYYDLFSSCVPKYKVLFLVLSIVGSFFGITLVESILVFDCRHKEAGMPPRIPEEQTVDNEDL